jgi:4-hydroxybenzoate polyprenyltransferase
MESVSKYLSLVKFSHTIFALPFAIIGFFLAVKFANFDLDWWLFALVVLCMVFARNAAMGFNRYIDKDIDKKNPRTAVREIPAGKIKAKSVLFFVLLNSLLFIITTWFINLLVFFLSPVALLVVLGYSYTKRFTFLCHFILGLGLSLAPIGAYLAVTARFDILPLLFSFIVLFWTSGFDIIYSLQDDDFDKNQKLFSVPAWLGKKKSLIVSAFVHLVAAALLVVVGLIANLGLWYWVGASIFVLLLAYQHSLVKPDDLSKVNIAFFTTNGIASVVFACFTVLSLFV